VVTARNDDRSAYAAVVPWPSREAADHRAHCARGALAGLRTRGPGHRSVRLLAVASRAGWPSAWLTAVVPAYRCGAVPDSHRVPSCEARPVVGRA